MPVGKSGLLLHHAAIRVIQRVKMAELEHP
jgi:hypothetical protein